MNQNPDPSPRTQPSLHSLADDAAHAGRDDRTLHARRRFLQMSGLALLGGAAASNSVHASIAGGEVISSDAYIVGLVANPELPGPAGDLILNVYLAVGRDGTGFGILSDPLHIGVNSHLEVLEASRQGNQRRYSGEIILSNTTGWIGQHFDVNAIVQNEFTAFSLTLNGQTFTGKGMVTDGTSNTVAFAAGSVR